MYNLVLALLLSHAQPGQVPATELATAIIQYSKAYGVNPEIVTRIIVVESKGLPGAYNAKTHDYGLMQINKRTAAVYGISNACLAEWRCNLRRGIKVLRDMQKSQNYRPCMYNVGNRVFTLKKQCAVYETKLASI